MKPLNRSVARAMGWTGLMMYLSGTSFAKIAKEMGRDRQTVRKYISKAADQMVDAAQEEVMEKLFPLALELYAAQMKQQIQRAKHSGLEKDAPPHLDIGIAERIMKGMFVLDRPSAKSTLADSNDADDEVHSLTALLIRKQIHSADSVELVKGNDEQKVIEGKVIDDEKSK